MDPILKRLQQISALRSTESLPFTFVSNDKETADGSLVARIPDTVSDKHELMGILANQLHFPGYFGDNWDALRDCLRDLSWLPNYRIVIEHEGIPKLLGNDELAIYIEILLVTIREWRIRETPTHELVAIFPEIERDFIKSLLIEYE